MTPKEIRDYYQNTDGGDPKQEVLAEIAAQLAEIKELLDVGKNKHANVLVWKGE